MRTAYMGESRSKLLESNTLSFEQLAIEAVKQLYREPKTALIEDLFDSDNPDMKDRIDIRVHDDETGVDHRLRIEIGVTFKYINVREFCGDKPSDTPKPKPKPQLAWKHNGGWIASSYVAPGFAYEIVPTADHNFKVLGGEEREPFDTLLDAQLYCQQLEDNKFLTPCK